MPAYAKTVAAAIALWIAGATENRSLEIKPEFAGWTALR